MWVDEQAGMQAAEGIRRKETATRSAWVNLATGTSQDRTTAKATVIMLEALENQQSGELLPGELLRGGEDDAPPGEAETALIHQLFKACFQREVEKKLVVDGTHATRCAEVMIKLLAGTGAAQRTGPHGEGVQILPAETGGELPEDAIEEETVGEEGRKVTAVFARRGQIFTEGGDEARDEPPLGIGQPGAFKGACGRGE